VQPLMRWYVRRQAVAAARPAPGADFKPPR